MGRAGWVAHVLKTPFTPTHAQVVAASLEGPLSWLAPLHCSPKNSFDGVALFKKKIVLSYNSTAYT